MQVSGKLSVGLFGHLQATFGNGVKTWNTFWVSEHTFDFKNVSELVGCISHFQFNSLHCRNCFNPQSVLLSPHFWSSQLNRHISILKALGTIYYILRSQVKKGTSHLNQVQYRLLMTKLIDNLVCGGKKITVWYWEHQRDIALKESKFMLHSESNSPAVEY